MYLPFIRQRIYVGEEVPHCLLADDNWIAATYAQEWKKRIEIRKRRSMMLKSRIDRKFEEDERKRKHRIAVSHHT